VTIQEIMRRSPVIPVLTVTRLEQAVPLARALVRGGLPVLEVTLRTACALAAIEAMRVAVPEALVGAGTLTQPRDLAAVAAAGAHFAVTPGLTRELVVAAGRTDLPLLPGIMTPSELLEARSAGFQACKLFPAREAGGPAMLRALAGPFPDQLFCPTGGVTPQSALEYLALPNVPCVGGSWMASQELLRSEGWEQIESLAREAARLGAAAGHAG
jgi:2-dehydro-3-deoxyphosphogluconate aldolase / (4S)-4-hydroxy-2-oxoglutarate aldolase